MQRRIKIILGATVVVAAAAVGTGAAIAGNDDDATERPISGEARSRAEKAALEHTGGGRVSGTEQGDEESLYEVEVTRADGSQVDVQLDENFAVVGDKPDHDTEQTN